MGNYKGGIVNHGVKKGRDGCINQNYINGIQFQPGCAVRVILNGRGDEDQRKTKIAWVEDIYTHHILLRVDTPRGPYRFSVNKVDLVMKKDGDIIKELV